MGVFTRLSDRDVSRLAADFDLGRVTAYETIAAGTINSNFSVDTTTGRWFVRINEGKSEADVAWEARLVEALAAGGVPTPVPRAARDGRRYAALDAPDGTKWVSAFPWSAGGHLAPDEVTPEAARRLGEVLATLHAIGLALPAAWRRTSIYDHAHLVARFEGFAASTDPALIPAIAVIRDELARLEAARAVREAATHGIIHGDLFRDNVLWAGGEVSAILDFEQASGGSLAYDLAVCLNDWCWAPRGIGGEIRSALVAAMLAGYQQRRALTPEDRAALLIEVRAAAVRFTITRITDVYLASVTNPEKDFRAFLARVEAWAGPALGQLSALL